MESTRLEEGSFQAAQDNSFTIDKVLRDNKKKEEEINHIKGLLEQNIPVLIEERKPQNIISLDITTEEEIAEVQLQKLKEAAKKRALTLEEARIYDILVKNKRLARKESTINLDNQGYRDVSEAELLKIASKSENEQ